LRYSPKDARDLSLMGRLGSLVSKRMLPAEGLVVDSPQERGVPQLPPSPPRVEVRGLKSDDLFFADRLRSIRVV